MYPDSAEAAAIATVLGIEVGWPMAFVAICLISSTMIVFIVKSKILQRTMSFIESISSNNADTKTVLSVLQDVRTDQKESNKQRLKHSIQLFKLADRVDKLEKKIDGSVCANANSCPNQVDLLDQPGYINEEQQL